MALALHAADATLPMPRATLRIIQERRLDAHRSFTLKYGSRRNPVSIATMTTKGQITIPVDVRLALKVEPGDRVEFVQIEPGRFEVVAATRSVRELKRRFGKPRQAVSIDDMNASIAAQAVQSR